MRIVSGGQTGVDRAALDAALAAGAPIGGWVPKGRLAEDGVVPDRYQGLRESDSADYSIRTTLNVRDSDATLILSRGPLTGGSLFTQQECARLGKPVLHVDLADQTVARARDQARRWLETTKPGVLNVAGPRASKDPDIGDLVFALVRELLG